MNIQRMFEKQASRALTKCPICQVAATSKEIKKHLDEGCPKSATIPNEENLFEDSESEAAMLAYVAKEEENGEEIFKASRQVTNNVKKFGGVETLTANAAVEIKKPSPKKPRFNSPFRHLAHMGKRGSPHSSPRSSSKTPEANPTSDGERPSSTPISPIPKRNLFTKNEKVRTIDEHNKSSDLNESNNLSPENISSNDSLTHVPLTQSKRQDPTHIPYYLVNFETVLRGVIDETDDVELFDENDLKIIQSFREATLSAKKLYVRLFQRKFTWISISSISYDEIPDKAAALTELVSRNLLNDSTNLNDLETVLNLLPAPQIKKLCKDFNLRPKSGQKHDGVDALMKSSRQKSFFGGANSTATLILKKARSLIEAACYILTEEPRKIFHRVLSLYSLSNWWDERDNNNGQPAQLTTILLQNTGRVLFPNYAIIRKTKIFRDKDDLLYFEKAITLESKISEVFDSKQYEEGLPTCEEARLFFEATLTNESITNHIQSMPTFLHRFSAGAVITYVLNRCVDLFEKLKKYKEAVTFLRLLLSQKMYLPDYRGHWYERLALDLETHLKQPDEALIVLEEGLADDSVREARRLALCQRVVKICSAKRHLQLRNLHLERITSSASWIQYKEPIAETIQGRLMPRENLPGAKTIFVFQSVIEVEGKFHKESLLCSVEELVVQHYKSELNYTRGLHGEGAVVNTICGVLFWDILYDLDVPDAFRSPHQAYPLDFNSDDFYVSRCEVIEQRLDDISQWPSDKLLDFARDKWTKYQGISASMCNWDLFKSAEDLCGLLSCLEGNQWSSICRRLITNHRFTRSGFPDLTLWNPELKLCRFVEVKGPSDRLSNKQILWLDYLTNSGIEAVVCHVEALNAKKLELKSPKKVENGSPKKNTKDEVSPKKVSPKMNTKSVEVPRKVGRGSKKSSQKESPSKVQTESEAKMKSNRTQKRLRNSSGDDFV